MASSALQGHPSRGDAARLDRERRSCVPARPKEAARQMPLPARANVQRPLRDSTALPARPSAATEQTRGSSWTGSRSPFPSGPGAASSDNGTTGSGRVVESDYSWDNILYEGLNPVCQSGTIAITRLTGTARTRRRSVAHTYCTGWRSTSTRSEDRYAPECSRPHDPCGDRAWNENDASTPAAAVHDTRTPSDLYARFR